MYWAKSIGYKYDFEMLKTQRKVIMRQKQSKRKFQAFNKSFEV